MFCTEATSSARHDNLWSNGPRRPKLKEVTKAETKWILFVLQRFTFCRIHFEAGATRRSEKFQSNGQNPRNPRFPFSRHRRHVTGPLAGHFQTRPTFEQWPEADIFAQPRFSILFAVFHVSFVSFVARS